MRASSVGAADLHANTLLYAPGPKLSHLLTDTTVACGTHGYPIFSKWKKRRPMKVHRGRLPGSEWELQNSHFWNGTEL